MLNRFLQFLSLIKKSGNIVEGYNKCEEGIFKGKIYLIVISSDCSENTKEKFRKYCKKYNVDIIEGYTGKLFGSSLGIGELNVIGVRDLNMSVKLKNLWQENDIN